MNAMVERPTGKLTKIHDPELMRMTAQAIIAELMREVKALKKELKAERAHTVDMLAIMHGMTAPRCQCSACTCTPTRSEMLSRR